jgi:ABC-type sugar transport system ATPase subunit
VRENLVISRERHLARVVRAGREGREYEEMKARLKFRAASPSLPIPALSGGNQQRVLVGRALLTNSRILVLNEPTRGVDIGARIELHQLLRDLAAEGLAIIVSSSDMAELVSVSDRCMVLSNGRQVSVLVGNDIGESTIVERALGSEQEATK